MVPKLFAIHAVFFAFVIVFALKTDFPERQPSSDVKMERLSSFPKY